MERKEFIKKTCTVCVALSAGWVLTELAACSHMPIFKTELKDNKVTLPLTLFATNNLQIISPKGMEYEIAVRKENGNTYTAMLMRCTHADNQLQSTGAGFVCSLHGSTFDKEGTVTQGPAETPMKHFPTSVSDTDIIITIN